MLTEKAAEASELVEGEGKDTRLMRECASQEGERASMRADLNMKMATEIAAKMEMEMKMEEEVQSSRDTAGVLKRVLPRILSDGDLDGETQRVIIFKYLMSHMGHDACISIAEVGPRSRYETDQELTVEWSIAERTIAHVRGME